MEEKKNETKVTNSFDLTSVIINCLMFLIAVIMKPITSIKEKIKEYSDVKTAGILVVVVSLIRMIINLIGSMISAVITRKVTNYWTGESKLSITFSNLKNLDYLSLIFKQFFGFILVVLIVAGIYYVVAMLMKKSINYFKVASITSVSFITYIIITSFVSVIISYIYSPLNLFLMFGSLIYSFITFVLALNEEIDFKNNNFKVYFHAICLTVVVIITYYVFKDSFSILNLL